jgi:hypothetical protein
MSEKQDLELAACTYFVDSYNAIHRTNLKLVEHIDKPDCVLHDAVTGEQVGVEVTHLYCDAREAKMVLGRLPKQLHGVMTISQLIEKLNADMAEKTNRAAKYAFEGKLILLIRVASPIFDKQDFEMYEDEIDVPRLNTFSEIWLLFWSQASRTYSDLMQLQ